MLRSLHIQNLMLVERVDISFQNGFNVITGETGSGKSALITALRLLLGARADSQAMRSGCSKGAVEATFDVDALEDVREVLAETGIEHPSGEMLIIRRELSRSGKSRSFVNNQNAQLAVLQKLGPLLAHHVGTFASQSLKSLDRHRDILDTFADLHDEVQHFSQLWDQLGTAKRQLAVLKAQEAERLREIDNLQRDLEEIDQASLRENEEDELVQESQRLTHVERLAEGVRELISSLSHGEQSLVSRLSRQQGALEQLCSLDSELGNLAPSLNTAYLELQELSHSLQSYQSELSPDPNRLDDVDDRLAMISRLKRKYGGSLEAVCSYRQQADERLTALHDTDSDIATLESQVTELGQQADKIASQLTSKRKMAAKQLSKALQGQIRELNMPQAQIELELRKVSRHSRGDDEVECFLSPNPGEPRVAVREHASGGELARVLLAIKTLLADKESYPTLIFDELDANIGGQTAVVVGEKLKEISENHQILCITHFPQLARQGDQHIAIRKEVRGDRTVTEVETITGQALEEELLRMQGAHTVP